MGNRAVISVGEKSDSIGIYLHWNGGVESVLAFLEAAKKIGVRDPLEDESYSMARLSQIICNFLSGTTGVGIGTLDCLDCDNGDNGHYIIGEDFKIVKRLYNDGPKNCSEIKDFNQKDFDEFVKKLISVNSK